MVLTETKLSPVSAKERKRSNVLNWFPELLFLLSNLFLLVEESHQNNGRTGVWGNLENSKGDSPWLLGHCFRDISLPEQRMTKGRKKEKEHWEQEQFPADGPIEFLVRMWQGTSEIYFPSSFFFLPPSLPSRHANGCCWGGNKGLQDWLGNCHRMLKMSI